MDDKDILKETNEYGYTALHLAIHSNSQKTVEIFLKKNIPDLLGKQDKYGQTALHWAVSKGNLSIIESLLNAMSDADILKITKEKATVLNFAKTHEIVEMLTKRLPEVITGYIASNSKREDLAKSESETHQQTLPAAPITFSIPKEESSKKPTSVNTQSESDGVYKNGK
jgi:ankyrin repeat protein